MRVGLSRSVSLPARLAEALRRPPTSISATRRPRPNSRTISSWCAKWSNALESRSSRFWTSEPDEASFSKPPTGRDTGRGAGDERIHGSRRPRAVGNGHLLPDRRRICRRAGSGLRRRVLVCRPRTYPRSGFDDRHRTAAHSPREPGLHRRATRTQFDDYRRQRQQSSAGSPRGLQPATNLAAYHVFGFNPRSLNQLLAKHGFTLESISVHAEPHVPWKAGWKDRTRAFIATQLNRVANIAGLASNMYVWCRRRD